VWVCGCGFGCGRVGVEAGVGCACGCGGACVFSLLCAAFIFPQCVHSTHSQDWKNNQLKLLGRVEKYVPELPERAKMDQLAKFNLSELPAPHLLIASVFRSGAEQKIILDGDVRARWSKHPVHKAEWAKVVEAFDQTFNTALATNPVKTEKVKVEPELGTEKQEELDWSKEPRMYEDMAATYEVTASFPGRSHEFGFTITKAEPKAGGEDGRDKQAGQIEKLWLVANADVEISCTEFLIAHGQAQFLKPKRGGRDAAKEGTQVIAAHEGLCQ
jgi:hypothetical protein